MTSPTTSNSENRDAYGRRHRFRAQLRNNLRRLTRRLMWSFSAPIGADVQFLALPPIDDNSVDDFAARTTWYLGRWSRESMSCTRTPEVPSYLDHSIDLTGSEQPHVASAPKHYLVWKVSPTTYLRALVRPSRVTIVDPAFAKDVDSEGYLHVGKRLGMTVPPRFLATSLAPVAADRMTASAVVLGTGPSAGDLKGDHTTWNYRIVCNSAIRDEALMERLRPTHICFGDPVFHFGPSAYAGQFREDLRVVAEKYDSLLVVPGYCAGLLAANLPWASGRLLPLALTSRDWHAPTMQRPEVRVTGNVLTQQMVPLAISLASKVDIGGADGRKPDEKYFWTHSRTHQYSDALMNTVFDAHPAFFRDTDYADYYAEHCSAVEELVQYGETLGCRFTTVTNSYIPALASRLAAAGR